MVNCPDPRANKFVVHEDEMGVNAPLIHQQTISRIHVGLGILYYRDKTLPYEPLPETMLGEESSPTPDLILYDHETDQTRVVIEICHARGQKSDLKKVIRLIEEDDYGILEGFVFNYKTRQWLRYRKGDGGVAIESSISDVLQLDLSAFL